MTTPLGSLAVTVIDARHVRVTRSTRETDITVELGLDGTGLVDIATGIGFYDHLLGSLAHHGLFDLEVRAKG
ncbi:MAG: imidazoleglycerol-phosphate dehydratase, partial [Chloroflexi bacterium]|nr:imidazoleglycerol-phosphate dehydratase [Chloroflexota bacterium]